MTDNRTTDTATTEHLRALLDERGIEWKSGRTNENNTSWNVGDLRVTAKELSDGTLLMQQYSRKHFTPEQAIAATLRNETLTAEQVREAVEASTWAETSTIREFNDSSWQAIADELNAALGSGTCELHYGEDDDGYDGWYCDECGGWFQAVRRDGYLVEPKHCQECGKAVKR